MSPTRRQLDETFPTFLRYLGAALGTILVLAPIVADVPIAAIAGGYPLATGMIFYKTVVNGRNGEKNARDDANSA